MFCGKEGLEKLEAPFGGDDEELKRVRKSFCLGISSDLPSSYFGTALKVGPEIRDLIDKSCLDKKGQSLK